MIQKKKKKSSAFMESITGRKTCRIPITSGIFRNGQIIPNESKIDGDVF